MISPKEQSRLDALLRSDVLRIRRSNMPDLGGINGLLDLGADPDAPQQDDCADTGGGQHGKRSVMEILMDKQSSFSAPARSSVLDLLIRRGCNPLRYHEYFGQMVAYSVMVTRSIMKALVERENIGTGCRTSDGCNALHQVFSSNDGRKDRDGPYLGASKEMIESGLTNINGKRHHSQIHIDWLHQEGDDGRTVAHVMWRQIRNADNFQWENAYWDITLQLLYAGVDFGRPDSMGVRASDLILEHLDHCQVDLISRPAALRMVGPWIAERDAVALRRQTQIAPAGKQCARL